MDHDAFCSLVRFVSSHNGAFETFEYSCGYGGNDQNYLLENPFASVMITPYMMARIVDISLFWKIIHLKETSCICPTNRRRSLCEME